MALVAAVAAADADAAGAVAGAIGADADVAVVVVAAADDDDAAFESVHHRLEGYVTNANVSRSRDTTGKQTVN